LHFLFYYCFMMIQMTSQILLFQHDLKSLILLFQHDVYSARHLPEMAVRILRI
ncbi:hypothetical protein T03_14589, partial [Trichinella britovi]